MKLLLSTAFRMNMEEGLARERQQAEMQPFCIVFQKNCISEIKQKVEISHWRE